MWSSRLRPVSFLSACWGGLLLGTLCFSSPLFASEDLQALSRHPKWLALLHYRAPALGVFGKSRSEIDAHEFFLSPNGKHDPLAELESTLAALRNINHAPIGPLQQHPYCAFPERRLFLEHSLGLQFPKRTCDQFSEWHAGQTPETMFLVYAAPFSGHPASLFGHTFLRLQMTGGTTLTSSVVSFEAMTTDSPDNPLYSLKGLLGYYPGFFQTFPYHVKVNHYSRLESRDLWEYELAFTKEELTTVLRHIWELKSGFADYYFIDENCSYHLLSLLEVVRPELRLREQFVFGTIPIDSVRAVLRANNLVVRRGYRPAILKVLRARLERLSPSERDRFETLKEKPRRFLGDESTELLDALLDWDEFQVIKRSKTLEDPSQSVDAALLLARSHAPGQNLFMERYVTTPNADDVDDTNAIPSTIRAPAPESGHASRRVSGFYSTDGDSFGIRWRPAFHDLLDAEAGHLPGATLSLGETAFAVHKDSSSGNRSVRLEQFTVGEVTSLVPLDRLEKRISYTVSVGLLRPVETGCSNCIAGHAKGGVGLSFHALQSLSSTVSFFPFALALAEIGGSGAFAPWFMRFTPSAQVGLLVSTASPLKFFLTAEHGRPMPVQPYARNGLTQLTARSSFSFKRWSVRAGVNTFLRKKPGSDTAHWTAEASWYY